MPDESDFAAVVARVQLLAQTAIDPALTLDEVQGIVRESQRASKWIANTAYAYGAYVIPTTPEGRRYRAIEAGSSGATQPTWPESEGGQVVDGTVRWEEAGPHSGSTYDVRKAVHECLALRYAKDQLVDASADGQSVHGSQRGERILTLMRMYGPFEIA